MTPRYVWIDNDRFNWNVFLTCNEKRPLAGPAIYVLDILIERFIYLAGSHARYQIHDKPIYETLDTIVGHLRAGTWNDFVLAV